MVREDKARRETSLVPNGSGVVAQRLAARFNAADWISEQFHGVSNLLFVRQLAERVEQDWPSVYRALDAIRQALLTRTAAICNATVDADNWSRVVPTLDGFLAGLPVGVPPGATWPTSDQRQAEAMVVPGQINFVGKAGDLYALGYTYHGSVEPITHYLRRTWLHEQVRLRGGAYGVSGGLNRRTGVFTYTSYRDPNVLATLEKYDQSPRFLRNLDLSDDELTKAIIGAISSVDPYLLPDAKGWVSFERYLAGESDESLQRRRDEILGTTAADFRVFGDVLDQLRDHGEVAILGNEPAINAAAAERPGWLKVWSLGL
jgi:hypothetical protein